MKRLLTLLLVVLVCLGCMTLVACGNNNDNNTDTDTGSTPAGPSNLDNAIEYVFSMYNSGLGDEAAKLEKDLTVIASVIVEKDSFNVEWSVEVTKGAADAVKVVDGANNTKTIDIPDYNDEQIEFTLKATVKGADGKTGDVSFKYYIPVRVKQEIDSAKKIVLQFKDGDTTKYITGKHYLYTSSSGSQKWELELTEVLAEALAITVVENDDNTVSFVAEGKYLFCDATNVKFVDTQDDNTKFVLEPTSNGVFIKCAVANFNGKAQYLEVYKGYLTCYGMNESSDPAIFTFSFVDADNTVAGTIVIPDNTDKPGSGDDTTGGDNTGDEVVDTNPSYIFGMTQANCDNKIYYLAGGMNGYYMETTEDKDAALKVYLEETEGGYYFYCYVDGTKTYINMVVSGEHVNGAYEATASTVYTLDAEKNTLIATVNDAPYWFGTRNDKTYTTMGPCKTEYEGFYGVLYPTTTEDDDTTGGDNTGDEVVDTNPSYIFGMTQANCDNKIYYLAGGMNGYYMETTEDKDAALKVYLEETEGGYYFYCYVDGTKTYINMVVSGEHVNGAYEATASTVYTLDAEKNTLIATVNDAPYWFGTRNDKTYTTMGPCKTEYEGFYGVLYPTTAEDDDTTGGDNIGDDNTPEETVKEYTISEALELAEGDKLIVSGTVTGIYRAWSDSYGNISVYISDENNNQILCFNLATKVGVGDAITVTGEIGVYQNVNQVVNGTAVINEAHVCSEYTEATCEKLATCKVCGATTGNRAEHTMVDGVCSVCGHVEGEAEATELTISFADKTNRTAYSTSQQIWEQNGIKVTNNKASSSSNVGDYADPARFYKSSELIIEVEGKTITKIVFTCSGETKYKDGLVNSIATSNDVTVSVEGMVVTVEFSAPVDNFTIASLTGGQARVSSMVVYCK